jgi:hypothetical protein
VSLLECDTTGESDDIDSENSDNNNKEEIAGIVSARGETYELNGFRVESSTATNGQFGVPVRRHLNAANPLAAGEKPTTGAGRPADARGRK